MSSLGRIELGDMMTSALLEGAGAWEKAIIRAVGVEGVGVGSWKGMMLF